MIRGRTFGYTEPFSNIALWTDNNYTIKWHEKDGNIVTFQNVDSLGKVGNISEKIDPRKSSINTVTFDFEVYNDGDNFSKFLYGKLSTKGKMFFREIVEVYKGEYLFYKGYVRSVKLKDAHETLYSIQLENVIGKLKTSLWDREFSEYLTETIADINSKRLSTGFSIEERTDDPAETPEAEKEYCRVIKYEGHIMDCLKGIMQMALSKPNISVNVLFLDNTYLNFLDIDNFNEIKSRLSDAIYNVYFEWKEPISNIFEFLQDQIFSAVGTLPVVSREGKLKQVIHQQPTVAEGISTYGNDEIIKVTSKGIDESQVVNNLKIKYNYIDEDYTRAILKVNSDSFEFFGNELIPEKAQEIEIQSINKLSRANQITFCTNIADLLFARYSREINTVDIRVPIQLGYKNEIGGFISLESDALVDWDTGERGLSETVEEIDPVAKFDIDKWGGFIEGNSLGTAPDGYVVIDTSNPVIALNTFRGTGKSFTKNHENMTKWVTEQLG